MSPEDERIPAKYGWLTERRLTFALKFLLAVVLVSYIVAGVLHFLERIGAITILLVAAIFFAYLIYPAVRRLNRKMPLILAILSVYAAIVLLLIALFSIVVPAISSDVSMLVRQYPAIAAAVRTFVDDPNNVVMRHLPNALKNELAKVPSQVVEWARLHGLEAASHAVTLLVGTVAALAAFVVVPVLAAYLLLEADGVKRAFIAAIPGSQREATLRILGELESVIGGFIRGQLLVGLSVGIMIAIALLILRVPYAVLIGAIAAVFDFIPYVGPVLAFVPAFFIALFYNGWLSASLVTLVFILANQVEGHFIAPNIVSRTVSLSPLAVLLAILIGGELGGLLGMLVAVPIAGMLRVLVLHALAERAPEGDASDGANSTSP